MKVHIKLGVLLKERGISQRELSRLTGIRVSSINEMCNNETVRLPLDNLAKICEVLGVEITDILELVDERL
ncbi:helix-turn-helix transcriptional regulator [Brevibacillus laterosporus]|uniref:helix-turn-helix domain-containing protein n=1 Tax=Bacillales TaxID=1385 RepID=UPI000F8DBCF1|nr:MULTISPECIES: helix-turn-helix transcriptional regulator [Bacillales]MCR8938779.1 helix-turn-helix transcriptional regulator [Brevibacillus laterosporus]MCZ0841419.1 helix-turn-helix transcriptional regulator [Brevibacillus laterosporus]MCZ0847689.1 helix-turn-helix transcriptional regulator [Brevibacillus laterosporus]RUR59895.1 XRE family transcriptional regulator [Bacillus sp. VKPM B-3276]